MKLFSRVKADMMMFFAKERFGEIGHQYRNLVCDSNEDGDKDDHEYRG